MINFHMVNIVFLAAGLALLILPPRKKNWIYGYRTPASLKDDQVFRFANRVAALVMIMVSVLFFVIVKVLEILFGQVNFTWMIFVVIGLTILITELKIRSFNARRSLKDN